MASLEAEDPELVAGLTRRQQGSGGAPAAAEAQHTSSGGGHGGHASAPMELAPVPWRAFLRCRPVQALAYTHFCNNWFHYTMLAWLPTYFTDALSLDLTHAALVAVLPPAAAIAASALAGPSADALITGGAPIATVRKAAQCVAFLGPAACLALASATEDGRAGVGEWRPLPPPLP